MFMGAKDVASIHQGTISWSDNQCLGTKVLCSFGWRIISTSSLHQVLSHCCRLGRRMRVFALRDKWHAPRRREHFFVLAVMMPNPQRNNHTMHGKLFNKRGNPGMNRRFHEGTIRAMMTSIAQKWLSQKTTPKNSHQGPTLHQGSRCIDMLCSWMM